MSHQPRRQSYSLELLGNKLADGPSWKKLSLNPPVISGPPLPDLSRYSAAEISEWGYLNRLRCNDWYQLEIFKQLVANYTPQQRDAIIDCAVAALLFDNSLPRDLPWKEVLVDQLENLITRPIQNPGHVLRIAIHHERPGMAATILQYHPDSCYSVALDYPGFESPVSALRFVLVYGTNYMMQTLLVRNIAVTKELIEHAKRDNVMTLLRHEPRRDNQLAILQTLFPLDDQVTFAGLMEAHFTPRDIMTIALRENDDETVSKAIAQIGDVPIDLLVQLVKSRKVAIVQQILPPYLETEQATQVFMAAATQWESGMLELVLQNYNPVFDVPYAGAEFEFISWCQKSGLRNAVLMLLDDPRIKNGYDDEFQQELRAVSMQSV